MVLEPSFHKAHVRRVKALKALGRLKVLTLHHFMLSPNHPPPPPPRVSEHESEPLKHSLQAQPAAHPPPPPPPVFLLAPGPNLNVPPASL